MKLLCQLTHRSKLDTPTIIRPVHEKLHFIVLILCLQKRTKKWVCGSGESGWWGVLIAITRGVVGRLTLKVGTVKCSLRAAVFIENWGPSRSDLSHCSTNHKAEGYWYTHASCHIPQMSAVEVCRVWPITPHIVTRSALVEKHRNIWEIKPPR